MAFDLEKISNDFRQLVALRDDHKMPKYADLALRILSVSPDTDIAEIRSVMNRPFGYQAALEKYILPVLKKELQSADKGDVPPKCSYSRNMCCPWRKDLKIPRCCCRGKTSREVSAVVQTLGPSPLFACAAFSNLMQDILSDQSKVSKPFADVVNQCISDYMANHGVTEADLYYNPGCPDRKTVTSWLGRGKGANKFHFVEPGRKAVTAFWIATGTYNDEALSWNLYDAAGINLSAQFNFDMLIETLIVKGKSLDFSIEDFVELEKVLGFSQEWFLIK